MKVLVGLSVAAISVLVVIGVLTWMSIPRADGVYSKYCIDGVSYLHFANGPMIQRDRFGNVVQCSGSNPKESSGSSK